MNQFLLASSDWGSSLDPQGYYVNQQFNFGLEIHENTNLQWVHDLAHFAQAGYLQLTVAIASFLLLVRYLLLRSYAKILLPETKASTISVSFELCGQFFRSASLALMVIAAVRLGGKWANAVPLIYAFSLGILRLLNDLEWRHVALHHVNFLLVTMLLVVVVGELLPYVDVTYNERLSPIMVGSIATLAAAVIVAASTPREWIPPSISLGLSEKIPAREPSPEETCSWIGYYLTYEWLTPLLLRGFRRQMTIEELPKLPWYDEPFILLSRILTARAKSRRSFSTVVRYLRAELVSMACFSIIAYTVELLTPFAMYKLLGYIGNPEGASVRPWTWLILLFIGPLSRSVTFQQYVFVGTRVVVRIKAALTQELYYKAMGSMELDDEVFAGIAASGNDKSSTRKPQATTASGRLANLMSADVDAVWGGRDIIMILCGVPCGTVFVLIGLYKLLGWPALVGTAAMLVLTPIPLLISRRMMGIQREMKQIQDSRISAVSEYLGSIRAIKYFAWEDAIIRKIEAIRRGEQKKIWGLNILFICLGQLTECIPTFALLLMFGLHVVVRKEKLTAEIAFTSISLVRTLRRNLSMASGQSRQFTAALVSLRRLDRYFDGVTPLIRHPDGPLKITNASLRRHKKAAFSLRDISIDFVEGGLNVVTGSSGSGKSTLLMGILGETLLERGSVTCPKDIAYASQTPWLQNETIRENILFNSAFEQVRYDRVIEACGLAIDMNEFSERDETEVGENGTSLSGGQKSRVALARALYSKAPVILLDDIFSALDAKTSAALWKEAFCGDLLQGRTIVLVTQLPWVAPQADLTIVMENGQIKDLQQNIGVTRHMVTINEIPVDEGNVDVTVEVAAANAVETNRTDGSGMGFNGTSINSHIKTAAAKRQDEVTQEALRTGQTARLQFFSYMQFFGSPFHALLAIAMSILSNASFVGTTLWLAVWVDAYENENAHDVVFYLGIYAAWTLGDTFFSGLTYICYERGGWHAARTLHNNFIRAIMNVPLSWFKTTPVGRIVNRFSRDMNSLDTALVGMLRMTIENAVRLCFQSLAVSAVLPVFMFPVAACCLAGIVAGEIYTRTAVAVKRLVSSAQSPVFAHFADSLAGLPIIRARAGMPETFGNQLADKLRVLERAFEAQFNCNRWVALRIDMMTTLVTVAAGAIAVSKAGTVAAGIVGFSLSNATTLNLLIVILVRAMNEVEVELQSYHRVKEYASVAPEEKPSEYKGEGTYSDDPDANLPKNWPSSGEIEFRNVTIKYDPEGPEVLKNINLKFTAGQRIAVVGRTGSGKSTLILSLLRFTNIVSGQILFDGVDITSFPRRRLREALTIIPQEAVLFNGDVGSNLDPTDKVHKEIVGRALEYCSGIASFQFHRNEGRENHVNGNGSPGANGSGITLATVVKAKGENFSHGQRQVLSLCRALVRKSKLMLLDEATASMDYETDRGIQEVLRKELSEHGGDRTLVTIAHRLKTIIDYDRVVVMSAGSVLEVGSPKELYEAQGPFYDMMRHSGEFEDLEKFLNGKS
ncbi:putative ABC transporter [Rosellinia necatrix]|uniref:Putative ABC transporter n=1 Tax=Rosellinia necatrix TaxID=77044 RepID=A0A1S7UHG2_ROSNE|nr:putative ABC transporter [Rosellinia necatrix]